MNVLSENLVNAIKGKHDNEPNRVHDKKVEQAIKDLQINSGGTNGSNVARAPYPPRLIPTYENGGLIKNPYRVRAIDTEGNLYGTTSSKIMKQNAGAAIKEPSTEWETVWEVPDTDKHGNINVTALLVTKTNRIIAPTQRGYVFVSDENQESFVDTGIRFNYDEASGEYAYTHFQFGYGQYENLVWLAGYAKRPVKANKSFISTDYGATWKECANIPIISEDTNMHIHDMQYDPYADRFWIVNGDQENCNIYYSDDYGDSWEAVFGLFSEDERNTQLTSIACFPHGVVFGSDHAVSDKNNYPNNHMEDCIRYWKRPKGERQSNVDPGDIKIIYRPYKDSEFRSFALKAHQIEVDGRIITLMPWYGIGNDNRFLLASEDGLNWYEIYRGRHPRGWQLAGFTKINGKLTIIGFDRDDKDNRCLVNMPLPKWINTK